MSIDYAGSGAKPSLLEQFTIIGLHGYRTISFSSEYAATILIAANGSGKTTIIGALDAFLRGHLFRLQQLVFTEIRCKIRGVDEELLLRREDINNYLDLPVESEVGKTARRIEIEPQLLLRFLTEEYPFDGRAMSENGIFDALLRLEDFKLSDALGFCNKLRKSLSGRNDNIDRLFSVIDKVLKGVEIVYLPTYRRIELPRVPETSDATYLRRRRREMRTPKVPSGTIYGGDMQFGLADISERLAELNRTILYSSNIGYRRISAKIINELVEEGIEWSGRESLVVPSKDELDLFFSRLKEDRIDGAFFGVGFVPDAERIHAALGGQTDSSKFLVYFLSKLNSVIKETRDIEQSVESFVINCNKYLSFQDESVSIDNGVEQKTRSFDDKVLKLDRQNLKVSVESAIGEREISLDALSSGEKQMISLFSKMFLYPGKEKIVLIDEPELSLSIDWQRQILVDVLRAPLCRQVVAITHSPFVFDNELEPFAKALEISLNLTVLPPAPATDF